MSTIFIKESFPADVTRRPAAIRDLPVAPRRRVLAKADARQDAGLRFARARNTVLTVLSLHA
jgi:hypothetical protein